MKRDAFAAEDPAQDSWSRTLMVPRPTSRHLLAPGTRVGEVEIAGVIGEGSAGIVYLAVDPSLERRVAVKEYLPSALAARGDDGLVTVRSDALVQAFRAGLDGFVAEARLLARFDHPSLVKVYRVWEDSGTAYLVMPYYEGPTLTRRLAELGGPPDEATLRGLLTPLLDALEMVHAGGQLHRDISADNILLTASGPVLLDFGVARRAIGGLTHTPTLVLKRGYAPIEQYGESDALKPGPWTDLYALGSVLHLAITGEAPGISVERLWDDWLEPLAVSAAGRYSPGLLAAIDTMLAVRPTQRPQDVAALRRLLVANDASADRPVAAVHAPMPFAALDGPPTHPSDAPVTAVEWPSIARARRVAAASNGARRAVALALVSAALAIGLGLAVRTLTVSVEQQDAPRPAPIVATAPAPATATATGPAPAPAPAPVVAPALAPAPGVATVAPPAAPEIALLQAPASTPGVSPATPVVARRPAGVPTKAPIVASAETTAMAAAPSALVVRTPSEPSSTQWPARCFDILQKASLERVSDQETAFLRETCR